MHLVVGEERGSGAGSRNVDFQTPLFRNCTCGVLAIPAQGRNNNRDGSSFLPNRASMTRTACLTRPNRFGRGSPSRPDYCFCPVQALEFHEMSLRIPTVVGEYRLRALCPGCPLRHHVAHSLTVPQVTSRYFSSQGGNKTTRFRPCVCHKKLS